METKFTKGEWTIEHEPQNEKIRIKRYPNFKYIASISYGFSDSEDKKTSIANAKIIAAAPDMLEALEGCVKAMKLVCSSAITPFIERA